MNEDHTAYKLLSDGDIEMISVRNLETLKADVDIKLNDFETAASRFSISNMIFVSRLRENLRRIALDEYKKKSKEILIWLFFS